MPYPLKEKMTKNDLDFIYNSNMIEGIDYPRDMYEDDSKLFPEIRGHKEVFKYMKKNFKKNITEKDILQMHKLLTNGLLKKKYIGNYRDCIVWIGGRMGSYPIAIKPEMEALIKLCRKAKSEKDIWRCHNEFEVIHPFADGNGRIGRLLLNWLMLKNGFNLVIIDFDKRQNYYNEIENYRLFGRYKKKRGRPKKYE